jgi:predicted transcriptional regulator of viral defense system
MIPSETAIAATRQVFEQHGGVMRTSAIIAAGIQPRTLYWMRDQGLIETLSRGVYLLASHTSPAKPDVVAVMARVPKAVLCLVSALDLHEIGTQIPAEVQIALPRDVGPPRIGSPRVRVFHMSPAAMCAGVEEQTMAGVRIRVFSVAKTIADCFKFRSRVGLDAAVGALQEVVRQHRATPGDILHCAKVDRVESVVRPYLEALL